MQGKRLTGERLERYVAYAYLAFVGIGVALGAVAVAIGVTPVVAGLFGVALIAAGWLGQRRLTRTG